MASEPAASFNCIACGAMSPDGSILPKRYSMLRKTTGSSRHGSTRGAARAARRRGKTASPRESLPIVEPVIPTLARDVPTGRAWVYEIKLDGFRGTLYLDHGRGLFRSKRKNVMRRFQPLADTLAAMLSIRNAIIDGEIIVTDKRDMPDFYALMFRRGSPEFAAFDLLYLNGKDLRERPYTVRKRALRRLLADVPTVAFVEPHDALKLFDAASRLDLEGIVAKRRSDAYGPATRWVKVKHRAYSQNEGRWELFMRVSRRRIY